MAVPGLSRVAGSSYMLALTASQNDVLIGDAAGDVPPFTDPIELTIYVAPGVVIGATAGTAVLEGAMRITSGIHDDSRILIVNQGTIQGRGGEGGKAAASSGGNIGGSGGGGAGTEVGPGGVSYIGAPGGTDGADGTDSAGGSGGTATTGSVADVNFTSGEDGGAAIVWGTHTNVTIDNGSGFIYGGGGGGGGGDTAEDGADGGGIGAVGSDTALGGVGGLAGYAYHGGVAPTFLGGSGSPNLIGPTVP